jgi:hypothetical protein
MTLKFLERPESRSTTEILHECATCSHKNRVYLSAPTGPQTAAVWRCGLLSQKTQREVLVQPHENCYEHRSLTDHWEESSLDLVR